MKKHFKSILIFILAVICITAIALLVGCGDNNSEQPSDENPSGKVAGTVGLEYTLSDDGEYYYLSGLGSAKDEEEIVIANYYNDTPVKQIGKYTWMTSGEADIAMSERGIEYYDLYLFKDSEVKRVTVSEGITTIGACVFGGSENNPTTIESISLPNSLTTICLFAFRYCYYLTSITIPDRITSIGINAFLGCENLQSITIPDSVTSIGFGAFGNCRSLTNITIPNSVTSIGARSFYNCSSLTSVTIGNSVTAINNYTFSSCSSLTSITIPDSVTSIGEDAFYNCSSLTSITIPDSVTYIGDSAFSGCSSLSSITIPDSVTYIGDSAFNGCSSLESITLPYVSNPLGYIFGIRSYDGGTETAQQYKYDDSHYANMTFYIPSTLKEVTITGGNILNGAFNNCSSLTSVTIGNSVTSIENNAFSGCSSLKSITLPFVGNSVKTSSDTWQPPFGCIFGTSSYTGGTATKQYFYGSSTSSTTYNTYYIPSTLKSVTITGGNILYGAFYNCSRLTSITIPDSVTSIGGSAFSGCSSLKSISIPNSVTSIGNYAFNYCRSLENITIPDGITEIGSGMFYDCNSLTSITIPDSVTSIGESAFEYCSSLTSINIPNSVTSIGNYAFRYDSSLVCMYYKGTSADWTKINRGDAVFADCRYTRYYYSETEPELNSGGTAYNGDYWHYNENDEIVVWKKED